MLNIKSITSLIIRYLVLILIAFPSLWIFYTVFTPLTLYPVFWLLGLIYPVTLIGNTILVNNLINIELIPACIAGAAYYLLLILNLSIPNIKLNKRLKMISFAFVLFLLVNILRIFILSLLAISGSSLFDVTHRIFWYLISTVFVVGIWFLEVKLFNIKQIPFFTDLKSLYTKSSLKS